MEPCTPHCKTLLFPAKTIMRDSGCVVLCCMPLGVLLVINIRRWMLCCCKGLKVHHFWDLETFFVLSCVACPCQPYIWSLLIYCMTLLPLFARNLQLTYWCTIWSVLSQEQQTIDPFMIYNPLYSVLREHVSGAVYGKQFQQLTESTRVGVASNTIYTVYTTVEEYHTRLQFTSCSNGSTILCNVIPISLQDLTLQDVPLLLLALYEKATLSRASALPSRQLLPDVWTVQPHTQCSYSTVCELPLLHDCRCWKSWTSSSRSVKYYPKRLDCHLLLLVFLSRSYSHSFLYCSSSGWQGH